MRRPWILAAISFVAAVACRTWRPIETSDEFRAADEACRSDDQVACGYLSDSLRESHRYERAWTLAQASCDAGVPVGCAAIGWFYLEGEGDVSKDPARGFEYLDVACQKGVAGACVDVAVSLINGNGVARNLDRAAWAADRACDGGHMMGCTNLGLLLDEVWTGHLDPPAARALFLSKCDAGSVAACRRAGLSLLKPAGGPKDEDAGRALLETACTSRDARACQALGERDSEAWATYQRGRRAFRLACAFDPRFGCDGLSDTLMMVDAGPDQWEAFDAAERGCSAGDDGSCGFLAAFLLREGLQPDPRRARQLAEDTCDAGQRLGCNVRARFEDGGGASWLRRAVELGHERSVPEYLLVLEDSLRRAEAARLCDAGRSAACSMPDGGPW